MSFLGIDIPAALAGTVGQVVYDLVVTRRSAGAVDPSALTDGAAITGTDYPARGYSHDYDTHQIDGSRVLDGDRQVTLYPSASMAIDDIEPEPDDDIVITTTAGTERYIAVAVKKSSSGALYRIQARPA